VRVTATHTQRLPLRVEAELFRVAQKALTNVRSNAHAREVEIRAAQAWVDASLSVRDDGRGFLPAGRGQTD